MFTGLIQTKGKLHHLRVRGNYRVLTIEATFPDDELAIGESIACDGACLTVTGYDDRTFTVEASQETVAKTILGDYKTGSRINLERALKSGDRLGGHMVSGHVDDTGKIDYIKPVGESIEIAVIYDDRHDPLVVDKGSVALNGVSLTINSTRAGWLSVNIIPHTANATTLGQLKKGDRVNLEFDIIGKYILKMTHTKDSNGLTVDKLKESGW